VRKVLPLASLFLLLLTIHPLAQSWAAWIAFAPLLVFIWASPKPLRDTFIGLGIGLVYHAVALYWIFYYNGLIYFKVVPLCALPWAVFTGLVSLATARLTILNRFVSTLLQIFLPAFVWLLLMFPFQFSPIGALPLEAPFYQPLPLLQMTSFGGMALLVFLILSFNASLALLVGERRREAIFTTSLLGLLVSLGLAWGFQRLATPEWGNQVRVALVQTNLPVSGAWREENIKLILDKYESLAKDAAKSKPALIIFPQYNLFYDAYRDPDFFNRLASETGAYIILGTYTPGAGGQYDIALVFSPTDGLVGDYRATQGPPFRQIGQLFGTEFNLIETPAGKMGLLLCFEDALPSVARKWKRKGADFLVTLSNTGHFTRTSVPHYHLLQDQLRAIENGLEVIRVTPNGYSAVIDARGRLRAVSRLGQEEILVSTLQSNRG
jgi:apolipoprotein N-acyltransferase